MPSSSSGGLVAAHGCGVDLEAVNVVLTTADRFVRIAVDDPSAEHADAHDEDAGARRRAD